MGTSKNQEAASGAAVKKRGQFKEIWRRLKKNRMAMISSIRNREERLLEVRFIGGSFLIS